MALGCLFQLKSAARRRRACGRTSRRSPPELTDREAAPAWSNDCPSAHTNYALHIKPGARPAPPNERGTGIVPMWFLARVLQHCDSVFRHSRICSRQLAGTYRGVRYAARRAVVCTFTRMALSLGRRNRFCLLALGVPQLVASVASVCSGRM